MVFIFKGKDKIRGFFSAALLILTLLPASICAFPGQDAAASTRETLAVVLAIDASGSMRHTDPYRLRETAARMFIDLLSPEDFLGIITFDHEVQVVLPLQQAGAAPEKAVFKERLSSALQPRGNTDFTIALEAARKELLKGAAEGARPVVVLLTDGEPDPDPRRSQDTAFMDSYMKSLWDAVQACALEGISVYTVGFSPEINPGIIQKISLDTRGDCYILNEPAEMLVSFFELLGNLKNRRTLVEEVHSLQGAPYTFNFDVDEYTKQVNLVAVSLEPSSGSCGLSLMPPGGEAVQVESLTLSNEKDYSMAVLSQPGETYRGQWQASVSGNGRVRLLGDMDLSVKGWLEEPAPASQHPLHEPLDFRVKVTGAAGQLLRDLQVEIQLKKPGLDRIETVPLAEAGGYYTGSYTGVDRAGTYELELRLLLDNQLVSSSAHRLYVKLLPALSTDFRTENGCRLGEDVAFSASLLLEGSRLQAGRDLKVEIFQLVLSYEDGSKVTLPLADNGNPDNGDIKARDGIWSSRFVPEREGTAEALLLAAGEYSGSEFLLEKRLGDLLIHAPGRVLLELAAQETWSLPGRKLSIPLKIRNESPFTETLLLETGQGMKQDMGHFAVSRFILEPGESREVSLDFNLLHTLEPRTYTLPLLFRAENALTSVEPETMELAVEIITPAEAFLRKADRFIAPALTAVFVLLATGILFYLLGMLFYCFLVLPRRKVRGVLAYWKTETAGDQEESPPQEIKLHQAGKKGVTISFDTGNKNADYHIDGSEFCYDIIIRKIWEGRRPAFILGWEALLHKNTPFKTLVQCTVPGIIEYEGVISTTKELAPTDQFQSGGFTFQYQNPGRGRPGGRRSSKSSMDKGVNILEGKM